MKRSFRALIRPTLPPEELLGRLTAEGVELGLVIQEQPSLFLEAVRQRVATMERRVRVETLVEQREAQMAAELRAQKQTGEKLTEAAIRERLTLDEGLQRLRRRRDDVLLMDKFAELVLDAFRERQAAQRMLTALAAQEERENA